MKTIIPSERDMVYLKAEVISLGYEIQFLSGGLNPDPDDTVRAWVEGKLDNGEDYQLTNDQMAYLAGAIEFEFPPPDKDSDGDIGTDQYDQTSHGYDKYLDRTDWNLLGKRGSHEEE